MNRTFLMLVGGVAAIVALGIFVLQLIAYLGQRSANDGVAAWLDGLREGGLAVSVGAIAVKNNVATLNDLAIGDPADPAAWRWSAPVLQVAGLSGGRLTLKVPGPQTIAYTAAGAAGAANGARREAKLGARSFEIDLDRGPGATIERLTLNIAGLSLAHADAAEPLTAVRLQAQLTRAAGTFVVPDGSRGSVSFDKLVLPAQQRGALGKTIDSLAIEFEFEQGLREARIAAALKAWQALERGRLDITRARIAWGLFVAEGEGIVQLDQEMRPLGRFAIRVKNVVPLLDALHVANRLDGEARADYYAVLLEELAVARGDMTEMELRLKGGRVLLARDGPRALGELPVGTLPALWPPRAN